MWPPFLRLSALAVSHWERLSRGSAGEMNLTQRAGETLAVVVQFDEKSTEKCFGLAGSPWIGQQPER